MYEDQKIPDLKEILDWLYPYENEGWVRHSYTAAKAARAIASLTGTLDPALAYSLGLIHDIGKQERSGSGHTLAGYLFLQEQGYEEFGKICITHLFHGPEINNHRKNELEEREQSFLDSFLDRVELDEYDKLIFFCDYVAEEEGYCFIEKRMVHKAMKHGAAPEITGDWQRVYEYKDHFEKLTEADNLYYVLPGFAQDALK